MRTCDLLLFKQSDKSTWKIDLGITFSWHLVLKFQCIDPLLAIIPNKLCSYCQWIPLEFHHKVVANKRAHLRLNLLLFKFMDISEHRIGGPLKRLVAVKCAALRQVS